MIKHIVRCSSGTFTMYCIRRFTSKCVKGSQCEFVFSCNLLTVKLCLTEVVCNSKILLSLSLLATFFREKKKRNYRNIERWPSTVTKLPGNPKQRGFIGHWFSFLNCNVVSVNRIDRYIYKLVLNTLEKLRYFFKRFKWKSTTVSILVPNNEFITIFSVRDIDPSVLAEIYFMQTRTCGFCFSFQHLFEPKGGKYTLCYRVLDQFWLERLCDISIRK